MQHTRNKPWFTWGHKRTAKNATGNFTYYFFIGGPGSVVGIATDYGLDGPVIEFRWGARFSAAVKTGPVANPASCTMGTGSFPRVKRPGRDDDPSPPSSAVVKKG